MDRTKKTPALVKRGAGRVKKIIAAAMIALFVLAMAAICAAAWRPLTSLVSDPESFRRWISAQGAWGPLVFVGLMAFQVIAAILPGEPLEIAAGYAFGVWGGTALCLLGTLAGGTLVFLLVRTLGRRAAELFFPADRLNALPFMRDERKLNGLVFLLFAIPGTPKDIMTYAVGLTKMRILPWMLISTLARIPSVITSTVGGDALGLGNYGLAIIVFAATVLISAAGLLIYRGICRRKTRED